MHNAKAGGEIGANGEFYKGGQFVADSADTVKGTYQPRGPHKECMAPYEWKTVERDEYGIWGIIEHFCRTEMEWNAVLQRSVVTGVTLNAPSACWENVQKYIVRPDYKEMMWYRRWFAYYGTLLKRWLDGERVIGAKELATLNTICREGRQWFGKGDTATAEEVSGVNLPYEERDKMVDEMYAAVLSGGIVTDIDKLEEKRAANRTVGYLGTEGAKVTFVAEVESVTCFPTRFGVSYAVNFKTDNGSRAVWFASNPPEAVAKGARLAVTCTVKETKENACSGEKETVVTRCKVAVAA